MAAANREQQFLAVKLDIAEGRPREALRLLDRVPQHTPEEEAQKLVLAGQSLEAMNDVNRAWDAYERALALVPAFPTPFLRKGVLRYRRGDREGARFLLYRYIALESGNPEAFYYLALCEQDPQRNASFVGKLAILDGPTGTWSRDLLRSLSQ
jgi:tetratricopeptide (TPR) repeat protein